MTLRIQNSWEYRGDSRWGWKAYLVDDGSGELDKVAFVEYVLHPSFRNPLVKVKDPTDGFVLSASGWGWFTLKAFVHMKSGGKRTLKHDLELYERPPTGTSK